MGIGTLTGLSNLIGEVVSVVTVSGEYVGVFEGEGKDGEIVVENPRMLIATEEGVGFARGLCMTGMADAKMVRFKDYVFLTATNDDFANSYREATSLIQRV